MQQPREQRKVKREKKWYFLTKMIKISPEGTPILFTFHFSLFIQGGVANICNTPFWFYLRFSAATLATMASISSIFFSMSATSLIWVRARTRLWSSYWVLK